jgi:hypothetical protein
VLQLRVLLKRRLRSPELISRAPESVVTTIVLSFS